MHTSNRDMHRPIRILSLDGGGIRGLSSLFQLRRLMTKLGESRRITPPASIRPCDCFDLIIGTGTGGISALFLGRMHMNVDEAIKEYIFVATASFKPPATVIARMFNRPETILDGHALERSIRDVVGRYLGSHDAVLEDDTTTCCTAILASTIHHAAASPHIFRSYSISMTLPASKFTVCEVACATMATGGLFPSISLGSPPTVFTSAGFVDFNNPAEIALLEAARIQPDAQHQVSCLVSFGTGLQNIMKTGNKWMKLMEVSNKLAQSCETLHYSLSEKLLSERITYFRFNIPPHFHGHVKEWIKPDLQDARGYNIEPSMEVSLELCVKNWTGEILSVITRPVGLNESSGKFLPLHHPSPKIFHGRESYIEDAITALLADNASYLIILGPGGIGKTSIARKILHDFKVKSKFGEHCRFVSCEGITSSGLLVNTLGAAFSLDNNSTDQKNGLLMYLKHAYTLKPLLLVLDNFETVWEQAPSDVEEFLEVLSSVPGISLMLTMRGSTRPAGLIWAMLPIVQPLDQVSSHRTFIDICGKEDENIDKLLEELDHIPLAVTLMAHLGQSISPYELLKRWNMYHTRLLSSSHCQDRLKNIDISIRFSLNSPRMQHCPEAFDLLSVIALLPAGIVDDDIPKICPSIPSCNLVAIVLCQVGLAYYDNTHTLCVLSPICAYMVKNNPPKYQLLYDLQSFYFQLAMLGKLNSSDKQYIESYRLLRQSATNIEAVLTKALATSDDEDVAKVQAAISWTQFLYRTTPRDIVIQLALKLVQGKVGRHILKAQCYQKLGDIQKKLSNHKKAQDMLSTAQEIFEANGDKQGTTQCIHSLGDIQKMLDNYESAQDMLLTARVEFTAIGDKLGAAQCLQSLGNIQRVLNNHLQAQNMLSIAKAELEAIGDRLGIAQCLLSLGSVEQALNNYETAQKILSAAHTEFETLGIRQGAAQCLQSLGNILKMVDDHAEAQKILSAAQAEFSIIGDRLGEAQCIQSLGNIHRVLSNYQKAQKMLFTAQKTFEIIGNRLGAVQCLRSLGNIQRMLRNYEKAQEMLSSALSQFKEIDNPQGAAQCLQSLGEIQYMFKEHGKAQKMFHTAKANFLIIGDRLGEAQCLRSLGNIQIMVNDSNKALNMLSLALVEFKAIGNRQGTAQCLMSLGNVKQIQNNWEEAQESFSAALTEFETIGDELGIVQCLRLLEGPV